jgi:hypothetical protein
MTIQKEIDNTFIATLESIIGVCEKTTSGNVSHNVATIKCKCRDMLRFYKKYPVNSWHEISRDKIPNDVDILIRFEDGSIKRYDEELPELLVTHWCEIPQFKEK